MNTEICLLSWGVKLDSASKAGGRTCPKGCPGDSSVLIGDYRLMAKRVVGFSVHAPRSEATEGSLAVVCECPSCYEFYWYHITRDSVPIFIQNCPKWPRSKSKG